MDGFGTMGALATDKGLRQLDGLADSQTPDHRRACRPFAENCGFTIAESAQAIVLFLFSSEPLEAWLASHGLPTIPLVPVSSSQAVIGAVMTSLMRTSAGARDSS